MTRPILYAPDGLTPIAFDSDESKDRALLLACFGALAGVDRDGEQLSGMRALKVKHALVTAIVDFLGREIVERYYNIQLAESDSPGPVLEEVKRVQ
jgi:hypothetical protein